MCGFVSRKTVQDPNHGEFVHAYFQKNRQDLLPLIQVKKMDRVDI